MPCDTKQNKTMQLIYDETKRYYRIVGQWVVKQQYNVNENDIKMSTLNFVSIKKIKVSIPYRSYWSIYLL